MGSCAISISGRSLPGAKEFLVAVATKTEVYSVCPQLVLSLCLPWSAHAQDRQWSEQEERGLRWERMQSPHADGLKQDFAEGQREKADGPRPQGTDYGTFNFTRHYQRVLFCFQALSLDDT